MFGDIELKYVSMCITYMNRWGKDLSLRLWDEATSICRI